MTCHSERPALALVAATLGWLALAGNGWAAGSPMPAGPGDRAGHAAVTSPAGTYRLAQADSAEQDEAERIRAAIEDALGGFQFPAQWQGAVTVKEVDGAFHIVIPGLTFGGGLKLEGKKAIVLDVGDVEIVAEPLADGHYRAELTLPAAMHVRDASGAVVGSIAIGRQRFEAVWAPEFAMALRLDAAYEDISIADAGGQTLMTLGAVVATMAFDETAPGEWSGPSVARVSDLRFANPDGPERLTMESLEISAFGEGMRLAEQARFTRDLNAVTIGMEQGGAETADLHEMLRVLETMPRLFSSVWTALTVNNVAAVDKSGSPAFSLEQFGYRFSVNGLDEERSSVEFDFEYTGLELPALVGVSPELVPRHIAVEIAAAGLPNQALWAAAVEAMKTSVEMSPEHAGTVIADRLPAAFLEAASELTLRRLAVDASGFGVAAEGTLKADPGAAYSVVARLDCTVRGFDRLVASLAREPSGAGANAAPFLTLIQALGVPELDETGTSVWRYRVELTSEGAMLLNGNDLNSIFDAFSGQQGPPPAQVGAPPPQEGSPPAQEDSPPAQEGAPPAPN